MMGDGNERMGGASEWPDRWISISWRGAVGCAHDPIDQCSVIFDLPVSSASNADGDSVVSWSASGLRTAARSWALAWLFLVEWLLSFHFVLHL